MQPSASVRCVTVGLRPQAPDPFCVFNIRSFPDCSVPQFNVCYPGIQTVWDSLSLGFSGRLVLSLDVPSKVKRCLGEYLPWPFRNTLPLPGGFEAPSVLPRSAAGLASSAGLQAPAAPRTNFTRKECKVGGGDSFDTGASTELAGARGNSTHPENAAGADRRKRW